MFSSPECITWFAAFLTMSVAIVTVNLLSIIVFIKNRTRSRSVYLVINLTVADMLVGGISSSNILFPEIGCKILNVRLTRGGKEIV